MKCRPHISADGRSIGEETERNCGFGWDVDLVHDPREDAHEADDERYQHLGGSPRELDTAPRKSEQGRGCTPNDENVPAAQVWLLVRDRRCTQAHLQPVDTSETLREGVVRGLEIEEEETKSHGYAGQREVEVCKRLQ